MDEETGGEGTSGGDSEVLSMAEELGKELFPENPDNNNPKEPNPDEDPKEPTEEPPKEPKESDPKDAAKVPATEPAAPAVRLPKGWKQEALDKFATLFLCLSRGVCPLSFSVCYALLFIFF